MITKKLVENIIKNGTAAAGGLLAGVWLALLLTGCGSETSLLNQNPADRFEVAAGGFHSCFLLNGDLECWGAGRQNSGNFQRGQAIVPSDLVLPARVAAGYLHTCAVLAEAEGLEPVRCWGAGKTKTGNNPEFGQSAPPTMSGETIQGLSLGAWHSCALLSNGSARCWGAGTQNNNTFPDYGQSQVPSGGQYQSLSSGGFHTCGLKATGQIECWGAGTNNTGADVHYGQSAPPGLTGVREVSSGYLHSCALSQNGVECWGSGTYGQTTVPETLSGPGLAGEGARLTCGDYHCCYWSEESDGAVCWGAGASLTVDGFHQTQSRPPGVGTVRELTAGSLHACAVDEKNGLVCWGAGAGGTGDYPDFGQSVIPDAFSDWKPVIP